jgi:transmembrane sensor
VDVHFTAEQRLLVLRTGRLLVEARDEARPLSVLTPFGQVRTTQARMSVAHLETSARAWVLRHQAQVISQAGTRLTLQAGQGAHFDALQVQPLALNRIGEAAWQDGWLEAQDWSLGEVLDALRPYCRGVLRASPRAAALRVSGSFSLDHSDRALMALEQTLPLRVQRYLGWWVSIDVA